MTVKLEERPKIQKSYLQACQCLSKILLNELFLFKTEDVFSLANVMKYAYTSSLDISVASNKINQYREQFLVDVKRVYNIIGYNMNIVKSVKLETIIFWDLMIVGLFYMVPTLSHLTSIPFYKFEPMRCVLLMNLLLTGNKNNAYIMAVTLPLFSFFVGGHPVFAKALLMAAELSANVFLFYVFSKRIKNKAVAMVLSILASKVFYYIIKFGIISIGFLDGPIFATGLTTQLIVAVVLSITFWKFSEKVVYKS